VVFIPAILTAVWIIGALICLRLLFRNRRRPFSVIFFTYVFGSALVLAGWMTLLCVWSALGGNPSLGEVKAGHFFVGEHGVYHEVSSQTYLRLRDAQSYLEKASWSWFLLSPIALIAAIAEFGWERVMRVLVRGSSHRRDAGRDG